MNTAGLESQVALGRESATRSVKIARSNVMGSNNSRPRTQVWALTWVRIVGVALLVGAIGCSLLEIYYPKGLSGYLLALTGVYDNFAIAGVSF